MSIKVHTYMINTAGVRKANVIEMIKEFILKNNIDDCKQDDDPFFF